MDTPPNTGTTKQPVYRYDHVTSLEEIVAFANELSMSDDPNSQFVRYCHASREELAEFLKDDFNGMSALYEIDSVTGKRAIIALCSFSRSRDPRIGHAVEMTLAVHPDYRQKRVGTQLMKKQLDTFREKDVPARLGVDRVDAYVITENIIARSLLHNFGFVLDSIETDKLRYAGRSYTVHKYIKYLNTPDEPIPDESITLPGEKKE